MKMYFFSFLIFLLTFSSIAAANEITPAAGKTTVNYSLEPTIGSWYGTSDASHWYGAFGELALWREETDKEKRWSPGVDLIASYSHGRVRECAYKWNEKAIGGGPAIKYADHDPEHPWQLQLKTRILFEQIDGDNPDDGYKVKQRSVLLNPYAEYVGRLNPKWLWGSTAEGQIALSRSIDSTWRGDVPSNRNTACASLFVQNKFSHDFQGRLTLAGVYQGWDKKSGIELSPELRIKETLMLGVKGAVIGGETVVTGYIRLELGKPLRDLNE
ncbi:MAG: hypothetical protein HGB26_06385 [Desulfobulbaceae bacterium]|nr:hypothetical protein [Desulfobulbaceae bacterium]